MSLEFFLFLLTFVMRKSLLSSMLSDVANDIVDVACVCCCCRLDSCCCAAAFELMLALAVGIEADEAGEQEEDVTSYRRSNA